MGTPSRKQIEANRLNALKSTGPRTPEGKARSRLNGLSHGLAAEVVVPEQDRAAFDAAMARWEREAGPDNVVEQHLIRRAAVGSVQLERIEQAREETRQQAAQDALRDWERRQQTRARKKAQSLAIDPSNTVDDLEATAFGCDWMIRQWRSLEAPLHLGRGWDHRQLGKAQNLLGLPEGTPGPDADRLVRRLWILAGAAQPGRVAALPRLAAEADLPTDPIAARSALARLIAEQVDRLRQLREQSWEEVEGPEARAVAVRAAAADTSKDGQLRHRYEVAADRSTNAAIRLFLNNRDRRRRELIEISKEARHCDTPRAPVGGGWWREPDSDPAPPGFARIEPDPSTSPTADLTDPPGAPLRSEAISSGAPEPRCRPNLNGNHPFRKTSPADHPGNDPRTEGDPNPDRPGRSGLNRPEWG